MKNKNLNFYSCYKCFVSYKMRLIDIIVTAVSILFSLFFAYISNKANDTVSAIAVPIMLLYFYAIMFDTTKDYWSFGGITVKKYAGADCLRNSFYGEAVLKKALITDAAIHWIKGITLTTIMLLLIGSVSKPIFNVSTFVIVLLFISLSAIYIMIVCTTVLLSRIFARSLSIHIIIVCLGTILMLLGFADLPFNLFLGNKLYPMLAITVLYAVLAAAVTFLCTLICIRYYRRGFADS